MSEPDELYTLRNHFWLGNYQMALSEGAGLGRLPNQQLKVERDEFLYRSYIALGQYSVVLSEVKDNAPPQLQACRLLATYLSQPESKEIVLMTLSEWLQDAGSMNNPTVQVAAATVYLHEGDLKKALQAVHQGVTLEQLALQVQVYLRLGRADLAGSAGGERAGEAALVFEELMDKFAPSPLLLNGAAAARARLGQWQAAEHHLVQALSKSQNDPDTLVNLIACYQHLDKPADFTQRYVNQLKSVAPNHPYVQSLATVEGAFERVAANYSL
eukprot:CAMPEP_0194596486 /NCGR_PEP_ID=MMETSP0292-20121207/25691_1 /TAXON_ID=39354 /ORGANISM="Heterosigma akashiwo, Strain CCMP2393" /LENGTH=270 /DNA_ID=CAMNT_0039456763 /DNA_START=78 /DNA_END=893 /DNA_ORIENTATION=-